MQDAEPSEEVWKERPEGVEGRPGDMQYGSLEKKGFKVRINCF